MARCSAAVLAALLVCAAPALAQVDRATLTGVVRDASDAVLPNAKVTVTSLATGVSSAATTSNAGVYLVVNLMPGEYLVQAEATGFQRYEQVVSLELGARSRLDLSLAVGSIGETVKVEGVTPLLSTESAVLGTVVDTNEVDKLPLAIRNWDDLLAMVPGVQSDRYTEQAGGTSAGRTGGISVHGNRSLQNNFLLDGVANNSFSTNVQELTTQISRPSVDAIDEFKVVTSPYAAEYGWSPGAAIIVNTKSGTNQLRGTAYDFYRDDRLDSINYFAKAANQPKAANKQNQFGGNVGGPLMRNRAFFFIDYEGTRLQQGVLRTGNVMTADQRRGVFTTSVRDPLTGQPFPNHTIPADRIDPVAAAIMRLVPLPNTTGANNFIRWNKVIGSRLVNESRVSWAMGTNDGQQDPFGRSGMADIGFKGVPEDPRVAGGIVGIDIDGYIRLGSPNFMPKLQHTNQVQWLNTTTWMRGSHQVKFGVDLMMPMTNEYFDVAPTRGNLRFQSTFTGNALGDFLLGYPNRAELTNVFVVTQELWSSSFFVQDDWKPGDQLTLSLGLRSIRRTS
ncbi:MAG: carboxypeptidase regulatory-like domain-containing protein [Cyanobacteria bacterium]|nr:carboxypeptidase regulatory-like domain-containing protein [Cyanobacteriota bacterium]